MIKQSIQLSESGLQLVDKIFEQHTKTILEELEKAKEETKKKLEKSLENKTNFDSDKLKTVLFEVFDLTRVQLAYSQLVSDEITAVDFNSSIDDFVKNTQSETIQTLITSTLDAQSEKATQMQLDIEGFAESIKDLVKKIKEIPESIVIEGSGGCGSFKIEPTPTFLSNTSALKVVKPGREISLITSYAALITSTMEKGRFEFQIETIGTINTCCLFGIVPEES